MDFLKAEIERKKKELQKANVVVSVKVGIKETGS